MWRLCFGVWFVVMSCSAAHGDSLMVTKPKTLFKLRLEDDAGSWIAGGIGYHAVGPFTGSWWGKTVFLDNRIGGKRFGVFGGLHSWD